MSVTVRYAEESDREWVLDTLVREWHGPLIERGDELVDAGQLPALVARYDDERVGLATLLLGDDFVEIITINGFPPGRGIGSALIRAVEEEAIRRKAADLRLYTTNDNLPALEFYQRKGFVLWKLHRDTMTRAREAKPAIPLHGYRDIPIRDEIELRKLLGSPH